MREGHFRQIILKMTKIRRRQILGIISNKYYFRELYLRKIYSY